ncbi:agmatinase [Aminipila terrae]|uniref:Agmatinase n=1 Tax=Aminipila terrae TaxID=2697030 RepID=A0A6P1MI62_9FIRM|nr:agmatinase [Aminipila terrae]QHI72294.1 agmatinase [Aminipila terrae]
MNNQPYCFMACNSDYQDASVVIFGAPYDGTVSYRPGTRFAPSAIRNESFGIETYSPYLRKDLEDIKVFDAGDLEFGFGNSRKVLDEIRDMTAKIINDNKIPVMLGGEHLVTLGCIEAMISKFPDLRILHFDAHADLREEYLGEELSHACVLRRCHELTGDNRIFQFGIRSMTREEDKFAEKHIIQVKYNLEGIDDAIEKLKGKPVYVTIDLDVLDPSCFSGTGTPEPGGLFFKELMGAVHKLKDLTVVGGDINELAPHYDQSGASTVTACKILREFLLTIK